MLQVNYKLLLNKYSIFVDDYFGFHFTNDNNNIEHKKNRDGDNNAE